MRVQDSFKGHIKRVLALEILEVLEGLGKDIKGLKKRERIKEEKSLKLKTLHNIHIKFCHITLHVTYI